MKTLFLLLMITVSAAHASDETVNLNLDSGKSTAALEELDRATAKKWDQLEDWQTKSSWIDEQVRLGVVGIIYQKGMFGANVTRSIVPDKDSGWLTVDTVSVPAGALLQIANLAGNIFFQEMLPLLQAQAIHEQSYVNVRPAASYREALLANPFKFKNIPVAADGFKNFAAGELVSTLTTGGVYVRAGANLLSLAGVEVDGATIGPVAKVQVYKQFKLTIAKQSENEIQVLVQNTLSKGMGIGLSMGLDFDDMIDAPISIGINEGGGYSPLRINYKTNRDQIDGIIYRMDPSTEAGQKAYASLMQRDFTVLDDLADRGDASVVRELVKHGVVTTSEFNMGLDLIVFRSGLRNIFVNAAYNSTIAGGKKFEYKQVSAEKINEVASWLGHDQRDEKYAALIPLNSQSFLIDTSFQYSDSDTSAKELKVILSRLKRVANDLPVDFSVDPDKRYGQVRAYFAVRFPVEAISKVLSANDQQTWTALGVSAGLPDPSLWASAQGRDSSRASYQKVLVAAEKTQGFLNRLRAEKDNTKQAELLIRYLKADNGRKLLHRTMIELAGRDQLLIQGGINGLYTPKPLVRR